MPPEESQAIIDPKPKSTQPKPKAAPPQFIPKLIGQKISIRMMSGGAPLIGTLENYNPYELMIQTSKGQILIFKHAIATIETMPEQKR
jgi:host factor-I protein